MMLDVSSEVFLEALLWIALVASVVLILMSTADLGRTIADLEYQIAAGINGIRRIRLWADIRTYSNRVLLGVTFVTVTVLLLADAPLWLRTLVNRLLYAVLMVSYATSSILDWRSKRRQVRMQLDEDAEKRAAARTLAVAAEQGRTALLRADHDSYKSLAAEAIASLAIVAARARSDRGDDPLATIAPVVPEHQSPPTAAQQTAAELQTRRAQLVAASLELGLPTRTAEPGPTAPAVEPESVDVASIQQPAIQSIVDAVTDTRPPAP